MDELKSLAHIFLTYVVPTGVSAILVGYYFNLRLEKYKNDLQSSSSIQLEKLKNELQSASTIELEKHKAELGRESKRREILLTKLREQQANVFEKLYEKFATMYHEMWNVTSRWNEEKAIQDQRIEDYRVLTLDFWQFYTTHRIFIPSDIDEKIGILYVNTNFAISHFRTLRGVVYSESWAMDRKEAFEFRDECDKIKTEIEKRFRIILGVDGLYDAASTNPAKVLD